jgi:hypothetical protein
MALQVNNYQLPQGVGLPAAYLKVTEAAIHMDDQPPDSNGVVVAVPTVVIFFKVYKDAASRLAGSPPFPDTPSVTLVNPPAVAAGAFVDQLYGGLALGLGVPNIVV